MIVIFKNKLHPNKYYLLIGLFRIIFYRCGSKVYHFKNYKNYENLEKLEKS